MPDITHLQFVVLGLLRQAPRLGREVRAELARSGVRSSGPAFYQMMARLEDAGLVGGQYDQKIVSGQIIKERRYEITAPGTAAWTLTRDFYLKQIAAFDDGVAHA